MSTTLSPDEPFADISHSVTPTPTNQPRSSDKAAGKTAVKTFVIDTNVLLHDPRAIFVFQDNNVVIPFTVLEELDTFKSDNDDRGRNARQTIRYLDRLRNAGRLDHGVPLGNGEPALHEASAYKPTGTIRVDTARRCAF